MKSVLLLEHDGIHRNKYPLTTPDDEDTYCLCNVSITSCPVSGSPGGTAPAVCRGQDAGTLGSDRAGISAGRREGLGITEKLWGRAGPRQVTLSAAVTDPSIPGVSPPRASPHLSGLPGGSYNRMRPPLRPLLCHPSPSRDQPPLLPAVIRCRVSVCSCAGPVLFSAGPAVLKLLLCASSLPTLLFPAEVTSSHGAADVTSSSFTSIGRI